MKRTTPLIIGFLLTTNLSTANASHLHDMGSLQDFLQSHPKVTSLPAAKHFLADAQKTAAGVLHYAVDDHGRSLILMGQREDDGSYCNLGGMSDGADTVAMDAPFANSFLSQTASREVIEESNGYYAHHPLELERLPFIDMLSGSPDQGSLLYRMYLKKVKLVDTALLQKASVTAVKSHSQEYVNFRWIPAAKVLKAILTKSDQVHLENAEAIQLYAPLCQILSTESGKTFLRWILKKRFISLSQMNKLYVVKEDVDDVNNSNNDIRNIPNGVRWHIPKVEGLKPGIYTTTLETVNRKGKNHTLRNYIVPTIPFGQNAWGQTSQTLRYEGLEGDLTVELCAARDHKIFCDAIAAHSAAMVEMKHKFHIKEDATEVVPVGKFWDPDCPLSISRIHLRMVLGPDFKEAKNFGNHDNPQRTADIENLRRYLTTHNKTEYAQKKVEAEFKRKITFSDHDLEIFADILEWEESRRRHPVFYHAATAELNNLWNSFTHVRELICMEPLVGRNMVLRGTDIYFRGVKSMPDILNTLGTDDYSGGKANVVLSANFLLTAGLTTTRSTSSSIEYVLNDHSVNAPDTAAKFDEAMALAGITADYTFFQSVFLQYLARRDATFENSVMLGISIPEDLLQDNSATDCHSTEYPRGAEVEENKVVHVSAVPVFQGIQQEYRDHKDAPESFEIDKGRKMDLIPEARLSLHPSFILSPQVRIRAFNRFPMPPQEEKEFNREVRSASIGTMSGWLQSQQRLMPDSFLEFPALKRLYNASYKATTGDQPQEKPAIESLKHLLVNGHVEGVRQFLETYPEALSQTQLDCKNIGHIAIRSDTVATLRFICEEFGAKNVSDFYQNQEEFIKAIMVCLHHESDLCLEYLLAHYDLSLLTNTGVESLARVIEDDEPEIAAVFCRYFPQVESQLLRKVFGKSLADNYLDIFISKGYRPEELFSKILKLHKNRELSNNIAHPLYNILIRRNADLSAINPETGQAYIFELTHFNMGYLRGYLPRFHEQLFELAACRDLEGRDIFTVARQFLERRESNFLLKLLANSVDESVLGGLKIRSATPPQKPTKDGYTNKLLDAMTRFDFRYIILELHTNPVSAWDIFSSDAYKHFKKSLEYLNEYELDSCNKYDTSDLETLCSGSITDEKGTPIPAKIGLLSEHDLKDPRVLRYILMYILRHEDESYITSTLSRIFPDKDEFIAMTSTGASIGPIHDYTIIPSKILYFVESKIDMTPCKFAAEEKNVAAIRGIIGFAQERLYDLLIKTDTETFETFIEHMKEEEVSNLLKHHPDLFTCQGEEQDFFSAALTGLPDSLLEPFVTLHKAKLVELDGAKGVPYFWLLLVSCSCTGSLDLVEKLVEENPSLLDLKNVNGMGLDAFIKLLGAESQLKVAMQFLDKKKRLK